MTHTNKTLTSLACAAALLAGTLVACVPVEETPPDLPPVGTLTASIEGTEQAPAEAKSAPVTGTGIYTNFANAWVRVKVLQLYAAGVVALPAVAIGLALSQRPARVDDRWVWSVSALGTTAELELGGDLVAGWDVELLVTNGSGTLDRFVWIEGHFAPDLRSGSWIGHSVDRPLDSNEVLEIEWTHESPTDRSLVFSNVDTASDNLGDVLSYALAGTAAALVFDDASEPAQTATITWDTANGSGSIQVPGYNAGSEACWDTSFQNADCP